MKNYRNIAIRTLTEFSDENDPKMTLGEVLYSIFREKNLGIPISEIKNMSDKEIYNAIEKAKNFEKE